MARKSKRRTPRERQRAEADRPLQARQPDEGTEPHRKIVHLLIVAGLCAAILAAYWNALGNGFVNDDTPQILSNPDIRTLSGLTEYIYGPVKLLTAYRVNVEQSHYRPLFWASLGLDHLVWGTHPFGYHLTNLLLHMANACLLYWLLSTLFSRALDASAIALLWALHPLQTEAVAYISGRVIAVATLFLLIGLLAWLRASRTGHASTGFLGLASSSFLLALLSHEIAVTYPLLLLWIDWYRSRASHPLQPSLPGRMRWLEAILLLAPLAAYLALRLTVAPFGKNVTGEGLLAGLGARLALVLLTLSRYLRLLLFPVRLSADWSNSIHPPTTVADLSFWLAVALLVAAGWLALRLRTFSRAAFFGVGWFVLTLLPVSNVVPLYSVLAERYLYLPSAGFCIALVMGAVAAADRLRGIVPVATSRSALAALAALLALLYGGRTALRNRDWRDDVTLASATLAVTPESFLYNYMLGAYYVREGRYDLAKDLLTEALRRNPDLATAYGSLGELYEAIGRDDLAGEAYRNAVRLQPTVWLGHFKLGLLYQRHGEAEQALEAFDQAVRYDPRSVSALNALAAATLSKGDLPAARNLLERVLALDPNNATAQANLGALYVRLGQPERALAAFQAAAAADPTLATAHYNLGLLYRRLGQPERARAAFRQAAALDPAFTQGRSAASAPARK